MDITILESEVNVLGVLLATIAAMVIGYIYYMPQLPTGKEWVKLVKLTEAQMSKSAGIAMLATVLLNLVTATLLAILIPYVAVINKLKEVPAGLLTAFIIWVFIAIASLSNVLFGQRRKRLWAIEAGYSLLMFLAMGVILVVV